MSSGISQIEYWRGGPSPKDPSIAANEKKATEEGGPGATYLSYDIFLGLSVLGGFFALDHLYLRSPLTFLAKLVVNMLFFGVWWLYDAMQALFNEDVVKIYGLGVPGLGPKGIAAGVLGKEVPDKKHMRFFTYAITLMLLGVFGGDSFLLGDKKSGFIRLFSLITWFFAPVAFAWWGYKLYKFVFSTKSVIESESEYFGAPVSSLQDQLLSEYPKLYMLLNPLETLKTLFTNILGPIIEPTIGPLHRIATEGIATVKDTAASGIQTLESAAKTGTNTIKHTADAVVPIVTHVADAAASVVPIVQKAADTGVGIVKTSAETLVPIIKTTVNAGMGVVKTSAEAALGSVKPTINTAVGTAQNVVATAKTGISAAKSAIELGKLAVEKGANITGKLATAVGQIAKTVETAAATASKAPGLVPGVSLYSAITPDAVKQELGAQQAQQVVQAGGAILVGSSLNLLPYTLLGTITLIIVSGFALTYYRSTKNGSKRKEYDDAPPEPGVLRKPDSKERSTRPNRTH